jgi:hypothetical protein
MEPVIYLEAIDRRGHVRERYRVDTLPATVGRSYRNAVILSDRYVSPEHLRIVPDEEGRIWAEDMGSANGLFLLGAGGVRQAIRVLLTSGTQFRVGRTVLRVCTPDQAVEPALKEAEPPRGFARLAGNGAGATVLLVAVIAALMLKYYMESYYRVSSVQLLTKALGLTILMIFWAAAWSFVNRVIAHRFDILAHLSLAAAATIALIGLQVVNQYLEFFLAPGDALRWLDLAGGVLLLAGLLYGHLSIMSAASRRSRLLSAVVVAGAIFGFLQISSWADNGPFDAMTMAPSQLKPVSTRLLHKVTIDQFLTTARDLKAEVDSMADTK